MSPHLYQLYVSPGEGGGQGEQRETNGEQGEGEREVPYLHQLHHGHRVEEMQSSKLVLPARDAGYLSDGEGGCVAGKQSRTEQWERGEQIMTVTPYSILSLPSPLCTSVQPCPAAETSHV